jgi:hypothetical protein
MSTELTHLGGGLPTGEEIETSYRVAKGLSASGFFKDARQAEQAFAKILLGRDLGLSPTQAMTSIHIVEGKPELSANLQAQLVRSYRGPDGERYGYRVLEHTDEACAIEFRMREQGADWEVIGTERFTMDDARRAGLAGRGPWKSYPRNMLWARCMSNGVNFHCPEVARGLRVFHEGEIDTGAQAAPAQSPRLTEPAHGPVAADPTVPPPSTEPEVVQGTIEPERPALDESDANELEHLCAHGISVGAWTTKQLGTQLRAHGAQVTTSVRAAIESMTDEGREDLRTALALAFETHEQQQQVAA